MRLPNVQVAVVEPEKIVDYILNPAHPDNGGKAVFFLGLGFRRDEWRSLAAALRKVAEGQLVAKSMASPHGGSILLTVESRPPAEGRRWCGRFGLWTRDSTRRVW